MGDKTVRLIDNNGNQIGIVTEFKARNIAENAGLDVVVVNEQASPPVMKLMDYGKFKYEQKKRQKKNKQQRVKTKELRVSPTIQEHDIMTKLKCANKFLHKGHRVKLTMKMRGRAKAHRSISFDALQDIIDRLDESTSITIISQNQSSSEISVIVENTPDKE